MNRQQLRITINVALSLIIAFVLWNIDSNPVHDPSPLTIISVIYTCFSLLLFIGVVLLEE